LHIIINLFYLIHVLNFCFTLQIFHDVKNKIILLIFLYVAYYEQSMSFFSSSFHLNFLSNGFVAHHFYSNYHFNHLEVIIYNYIFLPLRCYRAFSKLIFFIKINTKKINNLFIYLWISFIIWQKPFFFQRHSFFNTNLKEIRIKIYKNPNDLDLKKKISGHYFLFLLFIFLQFFLIRNLIL